MKKVCKLNSCACKPFTADWLSIPALSLCIASTMLEGTGTEKHCFWSQPNFLVLKRSDIGRWIKNADADMRQKANIGASWSIPPYNIYPYLGHKY